MSIMRVMKQLSLTSVTYVGLDSHTSVHYADTDLRTVVTSPTDVKFVAVVSSRSVIFSGTIQLMVNQSHLSVACVKRSTRHFTFLKIINAKLLRNLNLSSVISVVKVVLIIWLGATTCGNIQKILSLFPFKKSLVHRLNIANMHSVVESNDA